MTDPIRIPVIREFSTGNGEYQQIDGYLRVTPDIARQIVATALSDVAHPLNEHERRIAALERHTHTLGMGATFPPTEPASVASDKPGSAEYAEMVSDIGTVISEWGTSYWWNHNPAGSRLLRWFQMNRPADLPAECVVVLLSSRMCERGTKSCTVQHDQPAADTPAPHPFEQDSEDTGDCAECWRGIADPVHGDQPAGDDAGTARSI